MSEKVLITGGAGFIGSHVADELLERGYAVRVLDNLTPQVHGDRRTPPEYLSKDVEFIYGDIRDSRAVAYAASGVDAVIHLAAAVGVGQSMYKIAQYTSVNNEGTAVLLEALAGIRIKRLVIASSMSIYGEGLYRDRYGDICNPGMRSLEQLRSGQWEFTDAGGRLLTPAPTPETKSPNLASVYALSKYDQERMCIMIGQAYSMPAVALRFFNVYGPRQALSNPYTGVMAIFASRLLNGKAPAIFEDGFQMRDFVSVHDVARACRLALEAHDIAYDVFNIGSGQSISIREVAAQTAQALGKTGVKPLIRGKYRVGDIRHCFADIQKAQKLLGYEPRVAFDDGLRELAAWLEGRIALDTLEVAHAELTQRGLTV